MSKSQTPAKPVTGGGLKAIQYVLSCAGKVGPGKLAATVRSKNTCKACAYGTGGQRGGLHNEYSNRIEICNKNVQAHLSDIRAPIPIEIFRDNSIEELRQLTGKQMEDLGRLGTPLYKQAGDSHYKPIDYETAFEITAKRMAASAPSRSFFYASGRSSNEAAFLLQLFARVFGSNHVNNCSYYCHQASGVGLSATIGTGTATIRYADLHQADLIFVIGANPASNHPRFVKTLIECRQRGGQVIVINPVREAGLLRFASPANFRSMISGGTEVASLYVQPRIGGDIALLAGIARSVIESGAIDKPFLDSHCNGFDELKAVLESTTWADLELRSGVSREEMCKVATLYARSEKSVFAWGMGVTHHRHGTENIESISNLALLRGMIGAPGKGLLPLRGHSNVQGVGSMGFTPALKKQVLAALEAKLGTSLPDTPGLDTLACLEAAERNEMDFAFFLGGNLMAATPDATFASRALDRIPFKVMLTSTLNQTHLLGNEGENIVLPVRVRDEEIQPTTQESMFNYVRMSDGGFNRIECLQSEVEIISSVANNVLPDAPVDFSRFSDHATIRQTIAGLIPGFEAMATIDSDKQEFHITGRQLAHPEFPTADGRATLRLPPADQLKAPANDTPACNDRFMLTTVRSEGQFNTIIFNNKDVYRRQSHRQVLFMHPHDMQALGIAPGERVTLSNATGTLTNLEAKAFDIHRGNVMTYFPEANVLVPRITDSRSCTPAFKSVEVVVGKVVSVATEGPSVS